MESRLAWQLAVQGWRRPLSQSGRGTPGSGCRDLETVTSRHDWTGPVEWASCQSRIGVEISRERSCMTWRDHTRVIRFHIRMQARLMLHVRMPKPH